MARTTTRWVKNIGGSSTWRMLPSSCVVVEVPIRVPSYGGKGTARFGLMTRLLMKLDKLDRRSIIKPLKGCSHR